MLRIRQDWAKIGLNSESARLRLQSRLPKMELKSSQLKVQIDQEAAQVECDASQCRAEAGYLTSSTFSKENAQRGRRDSLEYIGQTAQHGDMLTQVEDYSNGDCNVAYAGQAWEDKEFVFARIPQSPVDIQVTPSSIEFNWQLGEVKSNLQRGTIKNSSTLPGLSVYLRQRARIDIDYVGSKVDAYR